MVNKTAVDWLRDKLEIPSDQLRLTKMKGATSSSVYLIEDANSKTSKRFVLRVMDNKKWLEEEPDNIQHEFNALQEAEKISPLVPKPISFNTQEVGFGYPVLLMSFVPGHIDLKPINIQQWITELSGQLALIHHHTSDTLNTFPWHYKSWAQKTNLAPPSFSRIPELWKIAIDYVGNGEPQYNAVFIHRDYHPTNVLWQHQKISGIVDWINACQGPAGVDVAHCRTNLALMYGGDVMQAFLNAYCQAAPNFVYEPYWDLDSLFDMCFPEPPFYEPWQEFGLEKIPPEILQQRLDNYLEQIVLKLKD